MILIPDTRVGSIFHVFHHIVSMRFSTLNTCTLQILIPKNTSIIVVFLFETYVVFEYDNTS